MSWTSQISSVEPARLDDPRWRSAASEHGLRDVVRWMATRKPSKWPKWRDSTVDSLGQRRVAELKSGAADHNPWLLRHATLINHSTVLLEFEGCNLITDPIFSPRCSPVSFAGPRRVCDPGVHLADLPRIDVVLLSHDHYDHTDAPSIRELERRFSPLFVVGKGGARLPKRLGASRVTELDWWNQIQLSQLDCLSPESGNSSVASVALDLPAGSLTYVPAQHFSGRGVADRNRALWGGFVLGTADAPVYFCGDTGFSEALFRTLRETFGSPQLALLPIGAYEPRWFMGPVHMDPAEAVEAHKLLGAARSLGIHYGTFQLTDEGVDAPRTELEELLSAEDGLAEFLAPRDFGDRLSFV